MKALDSLPQDAAVPLAADLVYLAGAEGRRHVLAVDIGAHGLGCSKKRPVDERATTTAGAVLHEPV